MLKLDNNLLDELGLGSLPEDQKRTMLQHIYETLELRVGTNLANQMSDAQLAEFEKFIDDGGDADQAQALQWLEANLPNYKQVVNDVFESLKLEVKQMAPQLVASSTQQPVMPAPQQDVPAYGQPAPSYQQQTQPLGPQQQTSGSPTPAQQAYAQPPHPAPQQFQQQQGPMPTADPYAQYGQPQQQTPPPTFQPPAGPSTLSQDNSALRPPEYPPAA